MPGLIFLAAALLLMGVTWALLARASHTDDDREREGS